MTFPWAKPKPLDSFERFMIFASQPSVARAIVNALESRATAGTFESWMQ